ncbi:hypothetical protein [Streptomyces aureus]|uniref:hypothetical protein n=1 Tax=Streptomyces aureus TaxID=193461 RepID=UPI000565D407|nr:hypothetical protein [Streptomyces aureus]
MTDEGPAESRFHEAGTRLARKLMLILLIILVPLAFIGFLGALLGVGEGFLILVLGDFVRD